MILITGATGTNGRELVELLNRARVPIRLMVRDTAKAQNLAAPNVEIVEGDFDAPQSLDAALKGVDSAFLLPPFVPNAVELQRNFIEAAKRAGVEHIVKLSVFGADVNSPLLMGRMHGEAEQLLENSGVAWTNLRPNGFMQNLFQVADSIKSQSQFYQPMADARVSLVDASDIAAVAAQTLTESGHHGQNYEITGPQAISFDQVAAALSEATGKTINYVPVSDEQFRQSMASYGVSEWTIDALSELYEFYRQGQASAVADGMQRVTGQPATSIEEFARKHAGAFQS